MLERGAGYLDAVLLFGRLDQLVIDHVPPGSPFTRDVLPDLGQREPDLTEEEDQSDFPDGAGRVRLIHTPVENLSISDGAFDAALAVNTVGMWPDPTARLRELARLLRPGGRIALVSQPRCPAVPVPPRPRRRRPPPN